MYIYRLSIAGTVLNITLPIVLEPGGRYTPFLTEKKEKQEITLKYEIGSPSIPGTLIRDTYPRVHEDHDSYYVERERVSSFCSCLCVKKKADASYHGWIYPGKENRFSQLDSLMAVSEMEILLSSIDAFSLHSSLIRTEQGAVLFTAPSGTGKSTQAELWRRFRNADILNGDRSLIRKMKGIWTAFGSPFAGSSEIYRNESAPICCIVVIRQSEKNEIRRLSPSEAFRFLYSETVIPRWNKEVHNHLMDLLMEIAEEVPVLFLKCTPNLSAVEELDQYMKVMIK